MSAPGPEAGARRRGDAFSTTSTTSNGGDATTVEHRIVGTTMPVLEMMLQPGEHVFAESGELAWISMAVQLRTGMAVGGQQGGPSARPGPALAGGTIFTTEYRALGGVGSGAFRAPLPRQLTP